MEEIDIFIHENNVRNAINDYVFKNIKPDLNKLYKKQNYETKKLDEKKIKMDFFRYDYLYEMNEENKENEIHIQNGITKHKFDVNNYTDMINKLNNIEETLKKEYENETHECVICLTNLKNLNKIKTKCNHTFCFDCINYNKQNNKNTGHLCPVCRCSIF
tara:strand:- start:1363 stop:1842 length:480 start_codon:yes stop_codon:yes gene_type:complete